MTPDQLKSIVEQQLSADEIVTEGDGAHFAIRVISNEFEGLSSLKRQQKIYALVNEHIASGDIHALTIKTYTPEEWQTKEGN